MHAVIAVGEALWVCPHLVCRLLEEFHKNAPQDMLASELSTLLLHSASATQLADRVEEAVLERLKPLLIKAQVTDSFACLWQF